MKIASSQHIALVIVLEYFPAMNLNDIHRETLTVHESNNKMQNLVMVTVDIGDFVCWLHSVIRKRKVRYNDMIEALNVKLERNDVICSALLVDSAVVSISISQYMYLNPDTKQWIATQPMDNNDAFRTVA